MSTTNHQKVYYSVLEEIRNYIDHHRLVSGDKLPSERELAETLYASRSSVREALRAMELLGLIQTRHGEGTFLSNYQSYESVELLASFILREKHTRQELATVKLLLEKEATKLAIHFAENGDFMKLKTIMHTANSGENEKHMAFFQYIFDMTNNLLIKKIWLIIVSFTQTLHDLYYEQTFYKDVITALQEKDSPKIEQLFFEQLINR
ncbi:FadR/GntR family transcriptional regulator [Virgibacillus soli]|uniref:GntR family transcriptional regulator n=1 Tax=Paracerasibacillus soli TaxID=480284 RepID=A0ABU5CQP0_9BACI|nr:GntR family transcriptional regulator [Virgibacillus soli]MDY0408654.1 GntR family transcriptional regulator [Virgibacillus soli]